MQDNFETHIAALIETLETAEVNIKFFQDDIIYVLDCLRNDARKENCYHKEIIDYFEKKLKEIIDYFEQKSKEIY